MLDYIFNRWNSSKKAFWLIVSSIFLFVGLHAQTFVFAQLSGSPVSTTGWNLQGSATVGNITATNNSEVIVCANQTSLSGAIFYNQPINLSLCNVWTAEFDFRIFDGTSGDGLAFCFLDTPPSGFVVGGGLGIPSTANGLKICFDTYPNCSPQVFSDMPKLEMRWGIGYSECLNEPTATNSAGALSAIRSSNYNHAKITYDNGTINVYLNGVLALTGFQQFNFAGYLGFTASTGGKTDNHSIKNVVIYTNMPPSEAGNNQTICSGGSVQVGVPNNANYVYNWTPLTGVSNPSISNPFITLTNNTTADISQQYFVQTAFATAAGCASTDSVTITVKASLPSISIATSDTAICQGAATTFIAATTSSGTSPVYQWKLNGNNVGANSSTFTTTSLANGDVVTCKLISNAACLQNNTAISNDIKMTVTAKLVPLVSIIDSPTVICPNTQIIFTAIPTNGVLTPNYQWQLNGSNIATGNTYANNNLTNGDIVKCTMTTSLNCVTNNTATYSKIIVVNPSITPTVNITSTATTICPNTKVTFNAVVGNAGTTPSYQWQINGNNVGTNNAIFISDSLNDGDTVTCLLTGTLPCSLPVTSNAIHISYYPIAVINMGADKVIGYGGIVQLNPIVTGNIASYLWTPTLGLNSTTILMPIASPTKTTVYQLAVTTADGCTTSDTTTVIVFIPLQMPSAFTPNGDGKNDVFRIPPSMPMQITYFVIYDRWGNKVFTTSNAVEGWDGTYNHVKQQVGTYVWMIEYNNLLTGKLEKETGTVTLIR
jgi:gliding motility-associated-like protein